MANRLPAQPGISVPDPQVYRQRLFTLLGDRDPLEVLAQTETTLTGIVRSHPATVLRTRPFENKWTPNEIIGHLVDGEWVYGFRLRLVRCEDHAAIVGTNQDQWVARQRHNDREPSELVEAFRTLRQLNLASWKQLSPADWERGGQHNERGHESLDTMLRMIAGHDLSHVDQITGYVQAILRRK